MAVSSFRKALEGLINQESMENGSNTPDFILAKYLHNCLDSLDEAVRERDLWYGMMHEPGKIEPGKARVLKLQILRDCFESYPPSIILIELATRFGFDNVKESFQDLEEGFKKIGNEEVKEPGKVDTKEDPSS